jgi:hypothetical protein
LDEPLAGTSDPNDADVKLPGLVDVFQEDPVVEAAALGGSGKTVTSTRSGISPWPATPVTPPNATGRPPQTGCPWLEQRGEYLIDSHHPLRETLISQLGPDPARRHQTLARRHTAATEMIPPWNPPVITAAV